MLKRRRLLRTQLQRASGMAAEALALAKSEGELSLVLRSYADTGGPSGRAAPATRQASAIRLRTLPVSQPITGKC